MKLAVVGIQGLPNKYGGFETLASYIAEGLAGKHQVTVYCSGKDMQPVGDIVVDAVALDAVASVALPAHFKNAALKYVNLSSHGFWGMLYDMVCLRSALKNNDAVLLLGFGAGFYMPFISKKNAGKIILNFGGLDWQRSKWSPLAKFVIKLSEKLLVKNAGIVVADNPKIKSYIFENYGREATLIAYGGDQAVPETPTPQDLQKYPFVKERYAFAVCRIQPDNNIILQLEAFKNESLPFVLVGNWQDSSFGIQTKAKYSAYNNLILLDAVYDLRTLNMLRSNCALYVHGHSAGGTNPSLIEAMHLGLNICAYTSGYNEATTEGLAQYFDSEASLRAQISITDAVHLNNKKMQAVAAQKYTWKAVVAAYENLCTAAANK
jgi:glycosyltransferase involved in cell wall biosynthesis